MNYQNLVNIYQRLEATTKRLEKTYIISEFLKTVEAKDLPVVILLLQGKVFPSWDQSKIGVASRLILKAIAISTGIETAKVENSWKRSGDLGKTAEELVVLKKQATLFSKKLDVKKVFDNLRKLPTIEGAGAVERKMQLIAELLTSAKPLEARYVVRTVLGELRVGVGEGSLRDAIVWAFFDKDIGFTYDEKENDIKIDNREEYNKYVSALQKAYDVTNDFSSVAKIAKTSGIKGLLNMELEVNRPVKVMLAIKVKDIAEGFERVGKPAAVEYKYDGFRCITGYTPLYVKNKGLVSARDIKKGDLVLTHNGRFRKILVVNKRKIDKAERLFEIMTFYGNKFRISEGHPLLTLRGTPSWINIEEIKKSDKLVFPIPKLTSIFPYKKNLNLSDTSGYHKEIKINDFFFRFLGYWIGDGFTNNYHSTERIGLIFNAKTGKKLCNYYEREIRNNFGIKKTSKNLHNGAVYLYWRDKPFRKWLSLHFRREWKGKMLPEWFSGVSKKNFESFLKGWIESDGHTDAMGRTSITTKERDLAMFASLLALKFGIMIAVKKLRISSKDYYKLIIPKSNRGYNLKKGKYFLIDIFKINELTKRDPRTTLYNFQVGGDESYCTPMATLHNCQIHKSGDKISVFTRRLEDVTKQFPEVVEYVKKHVKGKEFILDSEAVGFDPKTGKYLPFQSISQRIKRKYDIDKMAKEFPVELNIFDIIYYDGKNLINEWFGKRHELLWKIVKQAQKKIILAKNLITSDEAEVAKFYDESLKAGNEGIMFKALDAPYKPGARVGHMVKMKPTMETLDLVIVGADWGEGKRASWLSSFTIACIDDNGNFLEVGKVGTGIKEKEEEGVSFEQLTQLLKPLITSSKGKEVKIQPKVVIEVRYEEIQKSPTYGSGYALRFPRLVTIREDRSADDISTLDMVEDFYIGQKK